MYFTSVLQLVSPGAYRWSRACRLRGVDNVNVRKIQYTYCDCTRVREQLRDKRVGAQEEGCHQGVLPVPRQRAAGRSLRQVGQAVHPPDRPAARRDQGLPLLLLMLFVVVVVVVTSLPLLFAGVLRVGGCACT